MKLIRDLNEKTILLVDENDTKVLELGFFYDEFIWTLYTNNPVCITRDIDEGFYVNLENIMRNRYMFSNSGLCYKEENKIVWLSDQHCDISDEEETDKVNRLVIIKDGDTFKIWAYNPFFSKLGIVKNMYTISFSPAGNGQESSNLDTQATFQDDVVTLYFNIYNNKKRVLSKM